ncbi:MAG TPA: amidohydrolase family protein [Candidatus Binatia bacterium]|nr:amidohydrolase family protein [Candidatus Binatia bacterium]
MKKLYVLLFPMLLALAYGQVPAPAAKDATTTRYTFILSGNKAGYESSTRNPDGSLQIHFEFNDRGRGPNVNEKIRVGKDGIPVEVEITGVDYLKAPVDERFSLKQGVASWKNRSEEGQKNTNGKAFYASISGASEETGLLAQALLAAPGHKLPLLPAGEASIEKRSELKINANGQSRTVTQYAIAGLGFSPFSFWMDSDGNMFASVSTWSTIIREGWESAAANLLKAQDTFENERSKKLAQTLAHKPKGPLVFVHVNVFDSESAQMLPNRTVVITGNRITAVGADGQVPLPKNAETIDAAGKTLMPGLWDMHVHVAPGDGMLHMVCGVTSVRDLANDTDALMQMRSRFDEGSEIGPRVVMAGFIDGRGPYQGPTKVFADTEEEAKAAIDNYAKLGYIQIKVYSSLKPELLPKIVEMAHAHGMRVSGHVPSGMNAEQFVRDGVDEIQHMNFIFLDFMPRVKDTRTPARFTEVAAHGAEIDPKSEQVQAFIQLLKEHKIVLDPTLSIFEGMFDDRPGKMAEGFAPVADNMPAQVRRGFLYGGLQVPTGQDQRYQDSFQRMLDMAKTFYDAGIPIVAGTDSLAGFALHRELELYVKAGIPAPRVLQLATLGAARVVKRDSELGSIAPGKLADVILVEGDPAAHISDIRRVRTVVKDGVVFQVADMDRALGVIPAH